MRGRVHQIVHLHQIEALHAKLPHRVLHLDGSPPSLPLVQTLVATKSLALRPSAVASSPVTDSEEPYIGELSITRPPSSAKTFQGLLRLRFLLCIGGDVEHLPGAQPDCGDGFAGFRDARARAGRSPRVIRQA